MMFFCFKKKNSCQPLYFILYVDDIPPASMHRAPCISQRGALVFCHISLFWDRSREIDLWSAAIDFQFERRKRNIMTIQTSFFPFFISAAGAYAGSLLFSLIKARRASSLMLACGFVLHSCSLLIRGWHYETFLAMNMVSEIYFLPWCIAAAALWPWRTPLFRQAADKLIYMVGFFTWIALLPPVNNIPPAPQTATFLAPLFFFFEVIAHSMFMVAGWTAAVFLAGRADHSVSDKWGVWGFIVFSVSQVVGALWSWLGWSVPFHWSERHLLSAALWCFYCAYLHLQFSSGWKPRSRAWFIVCGALFTFAASYYHLFTVMGAKNG
jgi:hypothetical protein